jgi:biotin carboxylase
VTYVAERLGLPGNPFSAGTLLQRKDLIRSLQRERGLPHPWFVATDDRDRFREALGDSAAPFPLLAKPADSSGSKGQTLIEAKDQAAAAFDAARAFSRCGVVVAEEMLPADMLELVGDVYVHEGRLLFSGYGHNFFDGEGVPRVPIGEIVPGFFGEDVSLELDRQVQSLIDATAVRTGCMNFDALLSNGRVYLLDVGLRNGGNYFTEVIRLSSGVDLAEAAVHAALGEEYPVEKRHVSGGPWTVSCIPHSDTAGPFLRHEIDPPLRRSLVEEVLFVEPGDDVEAYTRGDRALGVCLFSLPTLEQAMAFPADASRYMRVVTGAVEPAARGAPVPSTTGPFAKRDSTYSRSSAKRSARDERTSGEAESDGPGGLDGGTP